MKFAKLLALIGVLLLAACSAPTETADPTPDIAPTDALTSTAQPAAAVAGQPSAVTFGRTDDGLFFHGAADAPVTLIDYADFL